MSDGAQDPTDARRQAVAESEYRMAQLGAMLKERRAGRFTVEELAAKAGLSAGLISQIERGIGNPSFATLMRLSQALDLPVAAMFQGPQYGDSSVLVRRADRRRMEVPADGIVHEMLTPDTDRKLGLIRTLIPAGFSNADMPYSHAGEEVVVVVVGSLVAQIGGQTFELEEGDSLSYDAGLPHAWTNRTDETVEIFAISTPPSSGGSH